MICTNKSLYIVMVIYTMDICKYFYMWTGVWSTKILCHKNRNFSISNSWGFANLCKQIFVHCRGNFNNGQLPRQSSLDESLKGLTRHEPPHLNIENLDNVSRSSLVKVTYTMVIQCNTTPFARNLKFSSKSFNYCTSCNPVSINLFY